MFRPAATKTGKKLFRTLQFHRTSAAVALRTIKTRNCLPFAMTSYCVGVAVGNVKQRNWTLTAGGVSTVLAGCPADGRNRRYCKSLVVCGWHCWSTLNSSGQKVGRVFLYCRVRWNVPSKTEDKEVRATLWLFGAFAKLQTAIWRSCVMSVRVDQLGSDWTDFHGNGEFCKIMSRKVKFH
jgi:hypothetical protein